jgi:hypothetical protein
MEDGTAIHKLERRPPKTIPAMLCSVDSDEDTA